MGDANVHLPAFLPKTVEFAPGLSYELLQPITTFRQCHDGSPAEGRIVLTCKRIQDGEVNSLEYIIKIKARVPERNSDSEATTEATSSNTTRAELKALSVFRNINNPYAPHLVDYKEAVQGPHGPLPGGYLTFTVMTKMPGDSLHNLYFWGMTDDERKEITERFLIALR
ncbi:hypothetical protein B0A52_01890 [Exophiala mesophila]|uniref:Uncharacterized protein n=1 Tax=Exophiala mesophila TaxID=212818 RepID=A0A438NEB8_EXOME|nr:hypothetical protein B0A52_01890 [Exophiala mesophila]